jgi:hypothetical protein
VNGRELARLRWTARHDGGVELTFTLLVAIVVGPFVVGWWIGNPLFAALVFFAMALTVALGAAGRGSGTEDPALGLALSLIVSAASAAAGGHFGAKRRARRIGRR